MIAFKPARQTVYLGNYYTIHDGYHGVFLRGQGAKFRFILTKPTIVCRILSKKAGHFDPASNFYYLESHQYPAQARLIFSSFFPVVNKVPWIVDIDAGCTPFLGSACLNRRLINKVVNNADRDIDFREVLLSKISLYTTPYCKAILFWSAAGLKNAFSYFQHFKIERTPEVRSFLEKCMVAHPVVEPLTKKVKLNHPPTVCYISRDFKHKGGAIALAAFEILHKRDKNIKLIYCGTVPSYLKKKHAVLFKHIEYYAGLSHSEVLILLKKSDVFLYPSPIDAFGVILLEALSAGCVPVTYWGKGIEATKEIIVPGRNGLLRNKPAQLDLPKEARRFSSLVLRLLSDKSNLIRMKRQALKEVLTGKFCYARRIRDLQAIFSLPANPSLEVKRGLKGYRTKRYSADDFFRRLEYYRKAKHIPERIYLFD